MSDKNQAALLEKIAGKRGANSVAAILSNFSTAENALKTSEESAGSAAKEFATASDSIEFKTNQLKASFEGLSTSVINSDFAKGALDFGTGFLSTLDKIISEVGVLKTALAGIFIFKGGKSLA